MQNYYARHHFVARGSKILIYCRVNSGLTPGVLPYAPAGQLKLFKIAPGDFVSPSRRVLPSLITFCINLLANLSGTWYDTYLKSIH